MNTAQHISDFIVFRLTLDAGHDLNLLKLQKLLYYSQAWHLAFTGEQLFKEDFQAWIHGPVNREVYDFYKESKTMYSLIYNGEVKDTEIASKLDINVITHVNNILETYSPFSATELEIMTHNEDPWIVARKGYEPHERCAEIIDPQLMMSYYRARLV